MCPTSLVLLLLTESIDTTTPTGKLTFDVFAALAEFERDLIRERTNSGLEAARARAGRGILAQPESKEGGSRAKDVRGGRLDGR
jgi:DNA invertase Pin-like site-specific DNA recombinase